MKSSAKRLVLLNTTVVTAYGTYEYRPVTAAHARKLITEFQQTNRPVESFVSHQSTADFLTSLLKTPVAFNRTDYLQEVDDIALVFKLRGRVAEGCVLNREEIEAMGYDFGLLLRTG